MKSGIDHIGNGVVWMLTDSQDRVLTYIRGPKCRDERGFFDTGSEEIEFGEDPEDAVRRGLREEFGIDPLHIKAIHHLGCRSVLRTHQDGVRSHWMVWVFRVDYAGPEQLVVPETERDKICSPTWRDRNEILSLNLHSQVHHHLLMDLIYRMRTSPCS